MSASPQHGAVAANTSGAAADDGARTQSQATNSPRPGRSAAGRLVRDLGSDYRHTFSRETAFWYSGGAAAAALVHAADDDIRDAFAQRLDGGAAFGSAAVQPGLAVGWWIVGHAARSARAETAGRDMLRAQINAATWTYVLKVAANRTRPNGKKHSFPSGHASATFATAMVLQTHYGWKLGAPMFAGASYVALSRVTDHKHWASDVVFGTVVGMASARTVTRHARSGGFVLAPLAVRGGAMLMVTRVN